MEVDLLNVIFVFEKTIWIGETTPIVLNWGPTTLLSANDMNVKMPNSLLYMLRIWAY